MGGAPPRAGDTRRLQLAEAPMQRELEEIAEGLAEPKGALRRHAGNKLKRVLPDPQAGEGGISPARRTAPPESGSRRPTLSATGPGRNERFRLPRMLNYVQ